MICFFLESVFFGPQNVMHIFFLECGVFQTFLGDAVRICYVFETLYVFLGARYVFWGARYVCFVTTYVFWERNIFLGGAICFFCNNICFFRSAAFVFGIQPVLQICLFSKCTGCYEA